VNTILARRTTAAVLLVAALVLVPAALAGKGAGRNAGNPAVAEPTAASRSGC
jgi:hypothetical protein